MNFILMRNGFFADIKPSQKGDYYAAIDAAFQKGNFVAEEDLAQQLLGDAIVFAEFLGEVETIKKGVPFPVFFEERR